MCSKQCDFGKLVTPNYYFFKRMKDLGITRKYTGFYYLVEIMNVMVNEGKTVRSFSREIYPMLAEKFNIHHSSIERDIRHIIKVFWDSKLKNELNGFWKSEKKPSCCKFIYLIKNYVVKDIA